MSYCAVSDVQAEFKSVVFLAAAANPTSLVTSETVTQMIIEASSLIDAYVGSRYVTPITADATALALMSLFARTLVADRVRGILANKQQTNTDANQQVKSDGFSVKNVMQSLQDIRNGVSTLSGSTLLLPGGGFGSRNSGAGETPRFKKDRKQW